jgi:hypothetical protein
LTSRPSPDGVGPATGLFAVTIDAPDSPALARFYADLLGMEVTYEGPEGAPIAGAGKSVMFQRLGLTGRRFTKRPWPGPRCSGTRPGPNALPYWCYLAQTSCTMCAAWSSHCAYAAGNADT